VLELINPLRVTAYHGKAPLDSKAYNFLSPIVNRKFDYVNVTRESLLRE